MKLLFDATELSYMYENSGHKAGVYYVSSHLLDEFLKRNDVEIAFVCDYKRYYFFKEVLKRNYADIKLIEEKSFLNRLIGRILHISANLPLKLRYALLILARYYDEYLCFKNSDNRMQAEEYDAYFSPFSPPSKDIEEANISKFRMVHDTIPLMESGTLKSPRQWYYKIYSKINSRDYYVTNSECTKKDLQKYFSFVPESHIKTTLLGAGDCFKPTNENVKIEGKYIFSLCTLGKRKNLEFGIRNFFEFIRKNNIEDLKLVLGGSIWEKYKKELNAILDKYDRSKVILEGYIDEKELAKYYTNALCFIYPSLYEGFGLPVLEAMQCGCPVITSNTSSLPEVIGDAGIKINPESDEEMIAAYEKMYFNAEFRDECRQKGFERAKQFGWDKCAHEILEFINNTLSV